MKFQGRYHQSKSQTSLSHLYKLIFLSLLVMRYIQGLEDEYNPELIASLMDHSPRFTERFGAETGHAIKPQYSEQTIQAVLCARMFPDYADC